MFSIIFRQELKVLSANRTWWAILGLLVLLTVGAALNGKARIEQMNATTAKLNQDETTTQVALKSSVQRYDANPVGDPPSVASPGNVGLSILGHYAVMTPSALAALSIGQSDVQPFYYRVTAHPTHTFLSASEIQNPLAQMTGSFDVAFVMIFVLPILIIAVSFDLMSREKEGGMLGLIAAQGVTLRALILAKVAARALILISLLLALIVLAAALVGADFSDAQIITQLTLWFAVIVAYAAFWFALAFLVNAMAKPSVTNGVILANLWLLFVVVLPSVVNVVASTLYPAPSRVELTTEIREATEEADKEAASAREAYLFDHPDLAAGGGSGMDNFYIQVLATDAAVEKVAAPIMAKFASQADQRESIVGLLQYTSPAIAAQQALNALAGTGNERFTDFVAQVLSFHSEWRGFFTSRIMKGQRLMAADFDAIPVFRYQPTTVNAVQEKALSPALFMLVVAALLIGWAIQRYKRYPVV
jgi:ABC-2 type transport system permease protein